MSAIARRLAKLVSLLGSVIWTLGSPRAAAADDAPPLSSLDRGAMTDAMHHYFAGEKGEGVWFMTAGFTALAAGGLLYARRTDFARGAMYPVVAIGVIQLVAGVIVYFRTDAQVARLDQGLAADCGAYQKSELERIRKVNNEFTLLKWTEIGLAAGGVGLAVGGAASHRDALKGIGVGLAIQSVAMLTLDLLAAGRAHEYTDALTNFRF